MVEALPTLVEFFIVVVQGAIELSVLIVMASLRPWRYVLSRGYRAEVAEDLSGRSMLYRVAYFGWGTVALCASVALVSVVVWFCARMFQAEDAPEPAPGSQARRTLVEKFQTWRSGK